MSVLVVVINQIQKENFRKFYKGEVEAFGLLPKKTRVMCHQLTKNQRKERLYLLCKCEVKT